MSSPISAVEYVLMAKNGFPCSYRELRASGRIDGREILKDLETLWGYNPDEKPNELPEWFGLRGNGSRQLEAIMILMNVSSTKMDGNAMRRMVNCLEDQDSGDTIGPHGTAPFRYCLACEHVESRIKVYERQAANVERMAQLLRHRKLSTDFVVEWVVPMSTNLILA